MENPSTELDNLVDNTPIASKSTRLKVLIDSIPSRPESIVDEQSNTDACAYRGSVKQALEFCDEVFNPGIKGLKDALRDAEKNKQSYTDRLRKSLLLVNSAIGAFELEKRKGLEDIKARMEKEMASARASEVVKLLEAGKDHEVELVMSMPATVLQVRHGRPEHVSIPMLKRFRVVDISKVGKEYMLAPAEDAKKIQQVVIKHGKAAEMIVGGIEFYLKPSVRSRRS